MVNQKKHDENKAGVGSVVAAATVAAIGAGIAVAGVAALKDEQNRKKVKKVLSNVRDQAVDYMGDMQQEMRDTKDIVEGKIAENKD
jgi:hypothetical protein